MNKRCGKIKAFDHCNDNENIANIPTRVVFDSFFWADSTLTRTYDNPGDSTLTQLKSQIR